MAKSMKTIKAKKSLGQNFLIDEEALTDIAHAVEIGGKHVIEVGPGYGALTEYLLTHHPATLDLVELDPDMIEILDERYMSSEDPKVIPGEENHIVRTTPIALHHTDVLMFTPPYDEYTVIANIPYYITSPILFHFLYPNSPPEKGEGEGVLFQKSEQTLPNPPFSGRGFQPPEAMVIMMQEEVGEKILEGRARKPHHSYLSLAMELACDDIEIVRYVGRDSFDPAPKVDSIVVKFQVRKSRDRIREEQLLALWKVAFTHPRKTLLSNLKGSHYDIEKVKRWLSECGYDEKVRAEAVRKEDWDRLLI